MCCDQKLGLAFASLKSESTAFRSRSLIVHTADYGHAFYNNALSSYTPLDAILYYRSLQTLQFFLCKTAITTGSNHELAVKGVADKPRTGSDSAHHITASCCEAMNWQWCSISPVVPK